MVAMTNAAKTDPPLPQVEAEAADELLHAGGDRGPVGSWMTIVGHR